MKEFVTAVEEVLTEDENEARIKTLMDEGKTREEAQAEIEGFVPFKLVEKDDSGKVVRERELHAFQPTEGQLIFMLASLGRGQTQDQRFASIINIMLSSLRDEDAEYLESRLLTRGRNRLPAERIEEIFEWLIEEWFGGKVTLPPSGSAKSQPSAGKKSPPPTT